MDQHKDFGLACPLPLGRYPNITLAHGGGGRLMHRLIDEVFMRAFDNPALAARHDGAILDHEGVRLAFTTDSHVVRPLFFPGGDIGSLAVYGTVNDLAMCGARPVALSAGFILEEGLAIDTLWRVVQSMAAAARAARVQVVTGDTKVVEKGKGDEVFINTTGIGVVEVEVAPGPHRVCPGDVVLLNGDVGRHGIAVMAVREGLAFETEMVSDLAPLSGLVEAILGAGVEVHCMRDLTRGGLATALNEIAEAAGVGVTIEESAVPVHEAVQGACELLGLDPLYVANEGRFITFVPPAEADRALEVMRGHELGAGAGIIGRVTEGDDAGVMLTSVIGVARVLDMQSGEQLPRIC